MQKLFCILLILISSISVFAENTVDDLSAKAFLEELMNRRYAQGLSTLVDKSNFVVSVQMQLVDYEPKDKKENESKVNENTIETPNDLLLGTIDPEQIIQQYNLKEEQPQVLSLLARKKIKTITVSVGLSENVGDKIKLEITNWLTQRVKEEFAEVGKTEVVFVKEIAPKENKKTFLDFLNQFQQLFSMAILAAALLIGIILWRLTTAKNIVTNKKAGEEPIKVTVDGKGMAAQAAPEDTKKLRNETGDEQKNLTEAIFILNQKIISITPKISQDLEKIVKIWCQAGDEGKLKLVCYAESVGREIGKLPIPHEMITEIGRVFVKMSDLSAEEKLKYLNLAYWDLMSVLNLGTDVLSKPFSYLSGVDTMTLSKVLMNQNVKMKTMVSLYLPDDMRRKFIKPLNMEQKLELLNQAVEISEVASDELNSMEKNIQSELKGGNKKVETIQLEMTLEKIIATLSMLEEIELLPKMSGHGIERYKMKYPSIAFFHLWPQQFINLALSKLSTTQLVTYLRLRPDLQTQFMTMLSPMMAEVVGDELKTEDKTKTEDKNQVLLEMYDVLKQMVLNKEIDLEEIFATSTTNENENNVIPMRTA